MTYCMMSKIGVDLPPGRSCLDHLSTITDINNTKNKCRQQTFAYFVDFSSAYDHISKNYISFEETNLLNFDTQGKYLRPGSPCISITNAVLRSTNY